MLLLQRSSMDKCITYRMYRTVVGLGSVTPLQPEDSFEAEPLSPVEPDGLSIEVIVASNVLDELGILVSAAHTGGIGNRRSPAGLGLLFGHPEGRGVHGAGCDSHHPNGQRGEITCSYQGKCNHSPLRRGIGRLSDLALVGGDGGSADDHSLVATIVGLGCRHRGGRETEHIERTGEVHVDGAPKSSKRKWRSIASDDTPDRHWTTMGTDGNTERTLGSSGGDRQTERVLVSHVGMDKRNSELGGQRLAPFVIKVGDDYMHASGHKLPNGGFPQAADACGDDC